MDLFGLLYLDELSHGLANLSMFPYFDMAHYVVSVMALREQPGEWLQVQVLALFHGKRRHLVFCRDKTSCFVSHNSDTVKLLISLFISVQLNWYFKLSTGMTRSYRNT